MNSLTSLRRREYQFSILDMPQEKGKISGNISVAFRYAIRLDDSEFTARQMSDT
ncbi:MAG: hypothetical protein ACR5LF_13635 [Symbiopectobacterium sp.]